MNLIQYEIRDSGASVKIDTGLTQHFHISDLSFVKQIIEFSQPSSVVIGSGGTNLGAYFYASRKGHLSVLARQLTSSALRGD